VSAGRTPRETNDAAPLEPLSYAEQVHADLRVRCIHLATKEAFVGLPEPNDQRGSLTEAIWWCEHTGDVRGPKGDIVDEDSCHGRCGRGCYEPPIRP
jgi:hypothetical protein